MFPLLNIRTWRTGRLHSKIDKRSKVEAVIDENIKLEFENRISLFPVSKNQNPHCLIFFKIKLLLSDCYDM